MITLTTNVNGAEPVVSHEAPSGSIALSDFNSGETRLVQVTPLIKNTGNVPIVVSFPHATSTELTINSTEINRGGRVDSETGAVFLPGQSGQLEISVRAPDIGVGETISATIEVGDETVNLA